MGSTLAHCLVISRLDHCNSVSQQNTAPKNTSTASNEQSRVVQKINSLDHYLHHSSKGYFNQLSWLPVPSSITVNIALLTFKSLSTSTSACLTILIQQKPHTKYSVFLLLHSSSNDLPRTTYQNKLSETLLLLPGTSYHQR